MHQLTRGADGNIQADPAAFPSGMGALAEYIHGLGLKFGLYSDAGLATCGGRPGSLGFEVQDARQYAEWGVDYLKCVPARNPHSNPNKVPIHVCIRLPQRVGSRVKLYQRTR